MFLQASVCLCTGEAGTLSLVPGLFYSLWSRNLFGVGVHQSAARTGVPLAGARTGATPSPSQTAHTTSGQRAVRLLRWDRGTFLFAGANVELLVTVRPLALDRILFYFKEFWNCLGNIRFVPPLSCVSSVGIRNARLFNLLCKTKFFYSANKIECFIPLPEFHFLVLIEYFFFFLNFVF